MSYQRIRESDVQVGHENLTRLAVDNSLHIGSLHYVTVNWLVNSVEHFTHSHTQDPLTVSQTLFL